MTQLNKNQILAASSGWVASSLNFLPGLGTGYIYQRRWRPYFFTLGAVSIWFALGIFLQNGEEPTQTEQLIGIIGLAFISIVTVLESYLAHKKSINLIKDLPLKSSPDKPKRWFQK
tara:strand:+ start:753 stop:1100 length:348 start_codon:yes stop_codon:yes gene_type:complete